MKKQLVGLAMCAAMTVGASSAALAGEVNGKGDTTPIKDPGTSKSLCAFSGLEDDPGGGPGVTQNWGQIIKAFGPLGGANDTFDPEGNPTGCNANLYPHK